MRIQKYLSRAGVASRRTSENYIEQGLVRVNKKIAKIGQDIDIENDKVIFKGKLVTLDKKKVYYLLYKPRGYICTTNDPNGKKTIIDLLKCIDERVYPVGRLDVDTEGLIILTNDGDFTYKMTHPKHHISKTYKVRCEGNPTDENLNKIKNGMVIENYTTKSAIIESILDEKETSLITLTIFEGRNRQIRKMFEIIGNPVKKLVRIKIGEVKIGELKKGEYRKLKISEVNRLLNNAK